MNFQFFIQNLNMTKQEEISNKEQGMSISELFMPIINLQSEFFINHNSLYDIQNIY